MSGRFVILRRNVLLALVAGGLGAAHLVLEPARPTEREIQPLLPELEVGEVDRIVLAGPGGEPRATLARDADEGAYFVEEAFGARAQAQRVSALLAEIGAMTDLDVVGAGPDAAGEFGLTDDEATRIELFAAGTPLAVLRSVPAEGGAAFVAVEGSERVVRVPRFRSPDPDPRRWFDTREVLPIIGREIREVRAEGTALSAPVVVRARRGDVAAHVDENGEPLDDRTVSELVQRMALATALDVVDVGEGIADPVLTLSVASFTGKEFQVTFGRSATTTGEAAPATQETVLAHRTDLPYGFRVRSVWLDQLVEALGLL